MKIGFDAKRVFKNFTGLGNYSRFVVRALAQTFPENDYLLYTPKVVSHPDVNTIRQLDNVHVRTPNSMVAKLKMSSVWRSYMMGSLADKQGADIFHGLSNELPFRTGSRMKQVVTIHDVLFMRYPNLYNPVDQEIYKRKTKHACKVADRIIAVSQQTADDIITYFGEKWRSKIDVVYQGCHQQFKHEYDPYILQQVKDHYRLPADFLLTVGTMEPRKNAMLILRALEMSKHNLDVPLVIAGKSTAYKKELETFININKLNKQVIFLENVPFSDLPKIYQLARIFIYPSLFEGFGIPIVEALNSKVPVISSKGGCFAEAGGPDSMYVDPESPEELGQAILKILNNPQEANRMIDHGLHYAANFEEERIAADLMRVYRKLSPEVAATTI
ncbi:glycosyltransferase family 4 protein [Roseivirga sp. BDSF3-8]|uniref:glycosyltransferase family 4 protein n=1 Tax=Roseivirga sp. BDSF3-8 TaxID=3241598 RepID=UPI0035320A98